MTELKRHPDRMFLDPGIDTPDKLIYAMLGWLAWEESPWYYKEGLLELHYMLEYMFDNIEGEEERQRRVASKTADAKSQGED